MFIPIVVTLAFFPIYLALRTPFRRLPLHTDSGYYVSGDTIVHGTVRFSRGWNAHFAGCSKVVPEFFYSWVYLAHDRGVGHASVNRCDAFKRSARWYASLYNYLTAIVVGAVAGYLSGGSALYYSSGLILFALVSSEPQWGVYFECGELLELPIQAASFGLLAVGLVEHSALCVAIAGLAWCIDAYFVKLSSIVGFAVLFGVAMCGALWSATPILVGAAAASALYLGWIRLNGRSASEMLRGLAGHEASFGQGIDRRLWVHRAREKATCLARTIGRQPLIPVLACAGVWTGGPIAVGSGHLLWAYVGAVLMTYAVQATNCWYYQIPLLVPMSLLAAQGAVMLAGSGPCAVLLLFAALIWVSHNTLRAVRMDTRALSRWCWNANAPDATIERDLHLEEAAGRISDTVAGRSLLVYGPMTQAYVLLHAAYPLALVTPEHCLDDVCPNWQPGLNRRLLAAPPRFVLDTDGCFDVHSARTRLGLDYRLTHLLQSGLRLYALHARSAPQGDVTSVRTFAPQPQERLCAEVTRSGDALVVCPGPARGVTPGPAAVDARALAGFLEALAQRGHRRIGVYGAGRYTARHADVYRGARVTVAVVLDDRPARHGDRFLDWPLRSPDQATLFNLDAVVVSTDRFAAPMVARARRLWAEKPPVFSVACPLGATTGARDAAAQATPVDVQASSSMT